MLPLIQFFLFSEVSVLACAFALGWSALRLLHHQANLELLALISSATFLFYTLERNLTIPPISQAVFPEKIQWLRDHKGLNLVLIFSSAVVTAVAASDLSQTGQVSLLILGFLSLCYSIIKFPRSSASSLPSQGLKRLPWAKSTLMVLVWTYMTLILPLLEAGVSTEKIRFVLLGALWASWIFSNTLLFDIRDIEVDHFSGCTTFAAHLGRTKAHTLIHLMSFIQIGFIFTYGATFGDWPSAAAMMLASASFLGCNLYLQHQTRASLAFYILADLTLILPAIGLFFLR